MNELKLIKKEYGIFDKKGEFFADSKHVAKRFGKRHDNVLRDIENLINDLQNIENDDSHFDTTKDKGHLNFEVTFTKNKSGRIDKSYNITRDGFALLVMGFTGKDALKFKLEYINKFNEYESLYKSRRKLGMESVYLTDSLKEFRESQGKETKFFHYSNEYDMINKIVLGMTAKQFKEKHGIDNNVSSIRDHLTEFQIKEIERMQLQNAAMIQLGYSYETRKESLNKLWVLRLN